MFLEKKDKCNKNNFFLLTDMNKYFKPFISHIQNYELYS